MDEILRTALLGTAKQELNINGLPIPIQKALQNANREDKEDFLLKAAVLNIKYSIAGKKPVNNEFEEIPKVPKETKKIGDKEGADNFLIAVEAFKKSNESEALIILMDKMSEENLIFPPESLVQIFNALTKNFKPEKKIVEKLHKIIGERGLWLLQFNEAWKSLK